MVKKKKKLDNVPEKEVLVVGERGEISLDVQKRSSLWFNKPFFYYRAYFQNNEINKFK